MHEIRAKTMITPHAKGFYTNIFCLVKVLPELPCFYDICIMINRDASKNIFYHDMGYVFLLWYPFFSFSLKIKTISCLDCTLSHCSKVWQYVQDVYVCSMYLFDFSLFYQGPLLWYVLWAFHANRLL